MRIVVATLISTWLSCAIGGGTHAGEAEALVRLQQAGEPKIVKHADGAVKEISINAPKLGDDDLVLFNDFRKLERITISHAGYGAAIKGHGVAAWKDLPNLRYVSVGGKPGNEILAAFAQLKQIEELFVQTSSSDDTGWDAIGTMTWLRHLGIRVRNDRFSKITETVFDRLVKLDKLESFYLSEIEFNDTTSFVRFVTTRPKLTRCELRAVKIPDAAIEQIRKAKPDLKITVKP